MATHPEARLASITVPGVRQPGPPGPPSAAKVWRVELIDDGKRFNVRVDDADGSVAAAPPAGLRPGPRGPQALIRALHEGKAGPIWKWIVTLTGLVPLVMPVTGVTTWIRLARRKRAARA